MPGLVLCFGSFVWGAETFSNASLLDGKSWNVSVYGRSVKTEPVVSLSGTDGIAIPTSGGSSTIFSSSDADFEMEQKTSDLTLAFNVKPREGLAYSLYVGQVQEFELEFSSASQTNRLESTSDGWRWGLGLSGMLAPISPVSIGVSWSLGYTQTNVSLDRFQGGPVVYDVDESLRQEEFQGSLQAIKRWKEFEPYVGLKLMRQKTRLQDNVSKSRVSGYNDGVSPFVGMRWAMFDREFLQVEGSFVDEESLTAGLVVQF